MMQSNRFKLAILSIITVVILAPLFAVLLHKKNVVDVPGVDRLSAITTSLYYDGFNIPYFDNNEYKTANNANIQEQDVTEEKKSVSILSVAKNMVLSAVNGVWDVVKSAGTAVYSGIKSAISTISIFVQNVVTGIYNGVSWAFAGVYNGVTGALSAVYDGVSSMFLAIGNGISSIFTAVYNGISFVIENVYSAVKSVSLSIYSGVTEFVSGMYDVVTNAASSVINAVLEIPKAIYSFISEGIRSFNFGVKQAVTGVGKTVSSVPSVIVGLFTKEDAELENFDPNIYEPAAGNEGEIEIAQAVVQVEEPEEDITFKYDIEDKTLNVEGVLVPQSSTVISSSRDGKIAKINFENGDMFQKGDILIEYVCDDIQAEMDAAKAEKSLTEKRMMRNEKLLKLDIISDIEHLGFKAEDVKASAQARIVEQRMEQCYIRAAYDGRVTNKLANEHEFTRTDRVLMEVASLDDLEVEFLVPSRWLRWVNVDAPIALQVNETDEAYDATIKRIYGEIDPVSQSIQMTAKLDEYSSPLLPGMSGTITIDVVRIRDAGIHGFLEQPRYSSNIDTAP